MSLVSNSAPSGLRIYEPTIIAGCPQPEELFDCTAHVRHKIRSAYRKAWELLKVRGGGERRFLCIGLLDPASNLVINSLISCGRKRKRERDRDREPSRAREVVEEDLERRSLDGMVAFLTRLFPDLADSQAVRYLFLADGDALVAAGFVVSDVGMKRFRESIGSVAMEMALLRCAALAAGHPDPDRLVSAWRNISSSSRIRKVLRLLRRLSRSSHHFHRRIDKLRRMLNKQGAPLDYEEDDDMSWAWQLAAARCPSPCRVPYRHTRLMTRTLHDAIHAFYLQALAGRLPAGELRSRLHRGLLKAGYCYGPLDPVSNIIINTIWYDAAFPPAKTLELDIIGTESLQRMENRSVYGLASFLCTRYHCIGFRQAVRCLLQADADLVLADHSFEPQGTPSTSVEEAFFAAAKAACC